MFRSRAFRSYALSVRSRDATRQDARLRSFELARRPRAHELGEIIMKAGDRPLAIGIGLGAGEAVILHALLDRLHVGEILLEHRRPILRLGILPLGLRLPAFRPELVDRALEDALVRIGLVGPHLV